MEITCWLELGKRCDKLFDQKPSLYGTLAFIFQDLAEEYENQAIPMERYRKILDSMRQPILDLLAAEGKSPEAFLACLDEVLKSFRSLKS